MLVRTHLKSEKCTSDKKPHTVTPVTVCSLRVDGAKSRKSRPLNFNEQVTFARCGIIIIIEITQKYCKCGSKIGSSLAVRKNSYSIQEALLPSQVC